MLRSLQLKRLKLVDVPNLTSHGFVENVECRMVRMSLLSPVVTVAGEGEIDVMRKNGHEAAG